jgi:hypothetical protein
VNIDLLNQYTTCRIITQREIILKLRVTIPCGAVEYSVMTYPKAIINKLRNPAQKTPIIISPEESTIYELPNKDNYGEIEYRYNKFDTAYIKVFDDDIKINEYNIAVDYAGDKSKVGKFKYVEKDVYILLGLIDDINNNTNSAVAVNRNKRHDCCVEYIFKNIGNKYEPDRLIFVLDRYKGMFNESSFYFGAKYDGKNADMSQRLRGKKANDISTFICYLEGNQIITETVDAKVITKPVPGQGWEVYLFFWDSTRSREFKIGEVYDWEKEKQEAKERIKDFPPPIICLRGKGGSRIYPRLEMGPDGEWKISDPEAIKAMLGVNLEELGKEEEPKED